MISPVLLNDQKYPKTAGQVICSGGLKWTCCDVNTPPG